MVDESVLSVHSGEHSFAYDIQWLPIGPQNRYIPMLYIGWVSAGSLRARPDPPGTAD